jgi:hypothetical protein
MKDRLKAMSEDQQWRENSQYILKSLDELRVDFKGFKEELNKEISSIKVELATLKTEMRIKASVWGLMGGALMVIPTLIFFIVTFYKK